MCIKEWEEPYAKDREIFLVKSWKYPKYRERYAQLGTRHTLNTTQDRKFYTSYYHQKHEIVKEKKETS